MSTLPPGRTEAWAKLYRAWLVKYAVHLAVLEALKTPERTVQLLTIRRLLTEDEVVVPPFDARDTLWLLDISRVGPFARRINGTVVLQLGPEGPGAYPHPGSPP